MKNLLKQFGLIILIIGLCWSCIPEEEDPIPPNIYDLEAEYWNQSVELNWKNPRYRDLNKIIISYFNNGEQVLEINPAYKTITIENLTNNQEYTFSFITEDYLGNKSEEISITETPKEIDIYKTQGREIEDGVYGYDDWSVEFSSTNMQIYLGALYTWTGFWERNENSFIRQLICSELDDSRKIIYDSSVAFCFDFNDKTYFHDFAWEKRSGESDKIEGVYVTESTYLVDNSTYSDTIIVYSDNTIKYKNKYGEMDVQSWSDTNLKNQDFILIEYKNQTYLYWNSKSFELGRLKLWEKQINN